MDQATAYQTYLKAVRQHGRQAPQTLAAYWAWMEIKGRLNNFAGAK